jgi:RND superfamily putative drug exporter
VITSAGLVLAGTFVMLATPALVILTEMGFTVALGVLIDTLVVRSVLVTAITLDMGRWIGWPSRLAGPAAELSAPAPQRARAR